MTEYILTPPITNRKKLIAALFDKDGHREGTFGMIADHVGCPYTGINQQGHCEKVEFRNITDEMCFGCKQEWLDKEVNE